MFLSLVRIQTPDHTRSEYQADALPIELSKLGCFENCLFIVLFNSWVFSWFTTAHAVWRSSGIEISLDQSWNVDFIFIGEKFDIQRLLPLPPSDWQDFSQDWFCGCCENHDTLKTPANADTGNDRDTSNTGSAKPDNNGGCCDTHQPSLKGKKR